MLAPVLIMILSIVIMRGTVAIVCHAEAILAGLASIMELTVLIMTGTVLIMLQPASSRRSVASIMIHSMIILPASEWKAKGIAC